MNPCEEVAVGGNQLLVSNAQFERSCNVLIWEEQQKLEPNNAIVDVLCNAIRLSREHCHVVSRPITEPTVPKGYYTESTARILPTDVAKLIEEARAPLLASLDKAEEALLLLEPVRRQILSTTKTGTVFDDAHRRYPQGER